MPRITWSEDEERQIEMALEVRRRHSKEIEERRLADEAARPKYDAAKPETNRRKSEKDRRALAAAPPKKRSGIFGAAA
jgi:hypothetical protein